MSWQNLEKQRKSANVVLMFYYIASALTCKSQTGNFMGILSRKCSITSRNLLDNIQFWVTHVFTVQWSNRESAKNSFYLYTVGLKLVVERAIRCQDLPG